MGVPAMHPSPETPRWPRPSCPFKRQLCQPGSIFSRDRGGSGGGGPWGVEQRRGGRLQQPAGFCL